MTGTFMWSEDGCVFRFDNGRAVSYSPDLGRFLAWAPGGRAIGGSDDLESALDLVADDAKTEKPESRANS